MSARASGDPVMGARNAVATAFVLNGLIFATLFSRVPDLRERLDLSNGQLGLLLLAISVGSLLGLPVSGRLIERFGAAAVCRGGGVLACLGMVVVALGAAGLDAKAVVAAGLGCYGFGTAVWDVAMNVEGAEVEQRLGRTVLPRFHAGWSFGSIGGAGIGVLALRLDVPLPVHFLAVLVPALVTLLVVVRSFLVAVVHEEDVDAAPARSAWLEPRTLAIGAMVLAFTLAEGAAERLARAGPGRRLRRAPLRRGCRVRALRRRDDHRPAARSAAAGPVRAGAGAAGLGGSGVRRPADGHRERPVVGGAGDRGGRHRDLGTGRGAGLPGRDERRGRRPAPRGAAGLGGLDAGLRRVPGRTTTAGLRGRRGRDPRLALCRDGRDGAGSRARAGRAPAARPLARPRGLRRASTAPLDSRPGRHPRRGGSARTPPPSVSTMSHPALVDASPTPAWLDSPLRPEPRPALPADATADLVVVGGGYTGLWTAVLAKERDPSRSVVLLEAQRIGWAASGRNGGFCAASLTHGKDNGEQRFPDEIHTLERLGRQNLTEIESAIGRYGIDCDFELTGALSVATEPHQVRLARGGGCLRRG